MRDFIYLLEKEADTLREVVFKILDEDQDGFLNIIDLIRIYVNIPKSSLFAEELRSIFSFYLNHSLLPAY